MALKGRLVKLEKRVTKQAYAVIIYIDRDKTEAEAIAEWEDENGPIGNREPLILVVRLVAV